MFKRELDTVTMVLVLAIGLVSAYLLVHDLVRRERGRSGHDTTIGIYARTVGLGLAVVFAYVVFFRFDLLGS